MNEIFVKLSVKEARLLSGLLAETQGFIQMHLDEENNEAKQIQQEKYIQALVCIQSRILKSLKK